MEQISRIGINGDLTQYLQKSSTSCAMDLHVEIAVQNLAQCGPKSCCI